jgi:hypothetical protein
VPRRGAAERLVVTLPGEPDAAARRDGIPRRGRRSDALALILARAPLATWTERFGRPPAQIAELPVADDFAALVHGALATAALDQRDAGWARVLWPRRLELLALLPDDEALPRSPLPALAPAGKVTWPSSDALAAAVPGPWGPELSRRVVATIRTELEWAVKPVSELAYALDPSVLGELEPLIEAGGARIVRLCDVLATRAAMLRELS